MHMPENLQTLYKGSRILGNTTASQKCPGRAGRGGWLMDGVALTAITENPGVLVADLSWVTEGPAALLSDLLALSHLVLATTLIFHLEKLRSPEVTCLAKSTWWVAGNMAETEPGPPGILSPCEWEAQACWGSDKFMTAEQGERFFRSELAAACSLPVSLSAPWIWFLNRGFLSPLMRQAQTFNWLFCRGKTCAVMLLTLIDFMLWI